MTSGGALARRLIHRIEENEALGRLTERISQNINAIAESSGASQRLDYVLHGAWMGHALHPALADVPVGAWTVAAVSDLLSFNDRDSQPVATGAISIGLVASLPAALSGLADWRSLDGRSQRVGMTHALFNSGALACYSLSLALRLKGSGPARSFGFLGYAATVASSYLGGHLVLESHAGVRHVSGALMPSTEETVLASGELVEGEPKRVEVGGYSLVLVRRSGVVYALADVCPHLGCSLASGSVQGASIVCPCHGSTFALPGGEVSQGPSAYDVDVFPVEERGGQIILQPATEES